MDGPKRPPRAMKLEREDHAGVSEKTDTESKDKVTKVFERRKPVRDEGLGKMECQGSGASGGEEEQRRGKRDRRPVKREGYMHYSSSDTENDKVPKIRQRIARKPQNQAANRHGASAEAVTEDKTGRTCRPGTRAAKDKRKSLDEIIDNTAQKKKKTPMKGDNALMCHQCQRNDNGPVVWCKECKKRRYCIPCITRWYGNMTEEEFAARCPVCRNNCNCKSCLRMKGLQEPPKKDISESDKFRYYCYILRLLLPWLKEFQREQKKEKELEAKIQGISVSELEVQVAACWSDERVYCFQAHHTPTLQFCTLKHF